MADDFLGEWEAWRHAREQRLTAPHGFLSITGLHWLDATPRRADGVPGAWSAGDEGVEVDLGPDESVVVEGREGEELRGHEVLGPVDETGIRVRAGELVAEVASRDAAVLLRPRDPADPRRTGHRPTPPVVSLSLPRRRPTALLCSTSTGRRTCRAPTRSSRRARCRCRRTG